MGIDREIAAVTDTRGALWYLFNDYRLSDFVRNFIKKAVAERHTVLVSSISLIEIVYLAERQRIPQEAFQMLEDALKDPEHVFKEAVVDLRVSRTLHDVSREEVPDMPDRIVAATALQFGVPVISRDRKIKASAVATIW